MTAHRLKLLLIPLLIVITTSGAIFAAEAQRTPEWQTTLNQYAATNNLEIIQVVRARQPHNFTDELDYPVVLPGQFEYAADITYEQTKAYVLALPYPPRQVQCALVEQKGARSLLFVNYYADGLWQNGWVIHRGATLSSNASMQIMDTLGCTF